jgi:hypothetical protein
MSTFPTNDRGIDMASASYRQMNPHQNPYIGNPGQQMEPPAFKQGGRGVPPPPIPPSYDYDQGPLGNSPQFPLPPKDIAIDTSGFRDEAAIPNYYPKATSHDNFVAEQEERLRAMKQSASMKRSIDDKFDWIAELQIPIIVGVLYFIFQSELITTIMSRYLKFAELFNETGNLNIKGISVKSVAFAAAYYSAMKAIDMMKTV